MTFGFCKIINIFVVAIVACCIYWSFTLSDSEAASPQHLSSQEREAQTSDIYEAVFRHQFKNNASAVQEGAKAFFLSIKNQDPSPEFLKRFAKDKPPVLEGSKFKGGEGLKLRIQSIKWINDDTVEIRGGYYEGNESASVNLYRIVRKNGQWVVIKDQLEKIS